jgi:retron-type reverse transcriptase
MKVKLALDYSEIVSPGNLLEAWREFLIGKRSKKDVIEYSLDLMDNILLLSDKLANQIYQHGSYSSFYVTDPKLRHIHKASVADRLVHHAVYRQLYPFFNKAFIADSYSCRLGKGTHKALRNFKKMSGKAGRNQAQTAWILQGDIRKFFESINHQILVDILSEYIADERIIWLLENVIYSYQPQLGRGLPLGNLTSQLFVNIYMNVFDQFIKHKLKIEHYLRYADDFVIMGSNKQEILRWLVEADKFLKGELKLELHPDKVFIKTLNSGVDFLGWVNFPDFRVLRTKTKRRMMSRIKYCPKPNGLASYLGLLEHGNSYKIRQELLNNYWINCDFIV